MNGFNKCISLLVNELNQIDRFESEGAGTFVLYYY